MGFNPSGGAISGASDIAFSNPVDNQSLTYDGTVQKWRNEQITASHVGGLDTFVDSRLPDPEPLLEKQLFFIDETTGFALNQTAALSSVFSFAPVVGATYCVDAFIPYDSTATADIKFRFAGTAGMLIKCRGVFSGKAGVSGTTYSPVPIAMLTSAQTMTAQIFAGETNGVFEIRSFVIQIENLGSAGTPLLHFQAAQNIAETNADPNTYRLRPGGTMLIARYS